MKLQLASACLLAIALSVSSSGFAQMADSKDQAKAAAAMPPATISAVVDKQVSSFEKEFTSAAEAMPAEKYNFAPPVTYGDFKGVRTFAEQVKHVAMANYIMFAAAANEKSTIDMKSENGPANITSKDDILKFLKDSFAAGHHAAGTLTNENFLERVQMPFGTAPRIFWATYAPAHGADHYGQMVEYLRMNSIIPPASMPQK